MRAFDGDVVAESVGVVIREGGPSVEFVFNQRATDRGLGSLRAAIGATDSKLAFQRIGRFFGCDVDGAAHGVAPVQCALRSFIDFNLLHIEQFLRHRDRVGCQHTVDHHRYGRIKVSCLSYAANIGEGKSGILRLNHEKVRHLFGVITHAPEADIVEIPFCKCHYGYRYFLQILIAFSSGNHDFFQDRGAPIVGSRRLGLCIQR